MSLDLVFAGATSGNATPGLAVESLAASLLNLLSVAGSEMDRDAEKAKVAIRRATSILRVELERRSVDVEHNTGMGELAAWQVGRVRAYIDEHIAERIHVKDLGAIVHRSTAHFCRAFKCTMGETPHSYITRRRLDQAQRLMRTTDAPLSEIAVLCGFSDQAHFCNRFRDATGRSPAAWRRERREIAGVAPLLPPVAARGELVACVAL